MKLKDHSTSIGFTIATGLLFLGSGNLLSHGFGWLIIVLLLAVTLSISYAVDAVIKKAPLSEFGQKMFDYFKEAVNTPKNTLKALLFNISYVAFCLALFKFGYVTLPVSLILTFIFATYKLTTLKKQFIEAGLDK